MRWRRRLVVVVSVSRLRVPGRSDRLPGSRGGAEAGTPGSYPGDRGFESRPRNFFRSLRSLVAGSVTPSADSPNGPVTFVTTPPLGAKGRPFSFQPKELIMPDTCARPDVNDLFFADFPHEIAGMERMDKYTLRKWLIGHAAMRGWRWSPLGEDGLSGMLCADAIVETLEVRVDVVSRGLRLTDCNGGRTEIVETAG